MGTTSTVGTIGTVGIIGACSLLLAGICELYPSSSIMGSDTL